MARSSDDTRDRLVGAAERLFAECGIHVVSLRQVAREAGQANTGAIQYHFGGRSGLLAAIVRKHWSDSEPRRHALLDRYEDEGGGDLRELAAALVLPLAAKLSDPDGGRAYLRISAELYNRPHPFAELNLDPKMWTSMPRWHALLSEFLPPEDRGAGYTRLAAIRFAFDELARRAASPARPDDRAFTNALIDHVTSLLRTRPSEQTVQAVARLAEAGSGRDRGDRPGRER
jgi:AcrR family transcriptional regulator